MSEAGHVQTLEAEIVSILRCPVTGSALKLADGFLIADVGGLKYPVRDGIPVLLAEEAVLPAGFASLAEFKGRFGNPLQS